MKANPSKGFNLLKGLITNQVDSFDISIKAFEKYFNENNNETLIIRVYTNDSFAQVNFNHCKSKSLIKDLFMVDGETADIKTLQSLGWTVEVRSLASKNLISTKNLVTYSNHRLQINPDSLMSQYRSNCEFTSKINISEFKVEGKLHRKFISNFKLVDIQEDYFPSPVSPAIGENLGGDSSTDELSHNSTAKTESISPMSSRVLLALSI